MKKSVAHLLGILFAGALLVGGCSTTKFKAFEGSAILEGKGGEMYSVDGIDFWKNGEPARRYRILGSVEETHRRRLPLGPAGRLFSDSTDRDESIAKVAQNNGGDAVIFAAPVPASSAGTAPATDESYGHQRHRRFTVMVIKYME